MSQSVNRETRKRQLWITLSLFFLFSLLIAQFYSIQIVEGKKWLNQANKQHYFLVKEPFMRGTFYSNPMEQLPHSTQPERLVIDVPKFHLFADPESIPTHLKEEIIATLQTQFNLTSTEKSKLSSHLYRTTRSRKMASWLDIETYLTINRWWQSFAKRNRVPRNALFFVKDYKRSYPCGHLLGQVLHTIQSQKDEVTHQALPTGGLELHLNRYLKGTLGKRRLMRSPLHSLETGEVIAHPENGADVYLTINSCLQAIVEEEIEKGVKKCKAKSGWGLLMDPFSGEILALGQYPFFDLSDYKKYFNDQALIDQTKVKAFTDANEPGSVFKPITIAIAMKANQVLKQRGESPLFSPEEMIPTLNGRFPGRSKPITDTSTHYYLNLNMAMQKSSNIYMARLVERIIQRLGEGWYRQELEAFGFGKKTGIEFPAESAGIVPTPGKRHPNGALEWSVPTPFSIAFGHNIQATSLQLARAMAVFANGGVLVNPTLIRMIKKKDLSGDEEIILDHRGKKRTESFPRIIEKGIVDRVVESMRYVTKPGGTATKADIPGYTVLGKTSTPKKIVNGYYSEKLYCPTFAGYAPVNQPAFVLVITIDEPEYGFVPGLGKIHNGGNCTAIVFKEIGRRVLNYLGVKPDDPYGYPYGDPRRDSEKAYWLPETRRLLEHYNKWNKKEQK